MTGTRMYVRRIANQKQPCSSYHTRPWLTKELELKHFSQVWRRRQSHFLPQIFAQMYCLWDPSGLNISKKTPVISLYLYSPSTKSLPEMELIKLCNGFSQGNDVRFLTTSGAILFVVEILLLYPFQFCASFSHKFRGGKKNPKNFLLVSHKERFSLICGSQNKKQSALVLNLNVEPSPGPFVVSI